MSKFIASFLYPDWKLKYNSKQVTENIMKHHEYIREFQPLTRITNVKTGTSKLLESVYDDLKKREEKGVSEYGVTLDKSKLSELELLEYLYEEILDSAMYTKALILKKKKKI